MQSVLKEFYYGNIRPEGRCHRSDSPFAQAARLKDANLGKLLAALNNPETELFEKYRDAQEELDDIRRYDSFAYSLKFGVLLMAEVFLGQGEITGD